MRLIGLKMYTKDYAKILPLHEWYLYLTDSKTLSYGYIWVGEIVSSLPIERFVTNVNTEIILSQQK